MRDSGARSRGLRVGSWWWGLSNAPAVRVGDHLRVAAADVQDDRILGTRDQPAHLNVCGRQRDWTELRRGRARARAWVHARVSLRPMQWFTPTSGLFHSCASIRATVAPATSGGPIPGPGQGVPKASCVRDWHTRWVLGGGRH